MGIRERCIMKTKIPGVTGYLMKMVSDVNYISAKLWMSRKMESRSNQSETLAREHSVKYGTRATHLTGRGLANDNGMSIRMPRPGCWVRIMPFYLMLLLMIAPTEILDMFYNFKADTTDEECGHSWARQTQMA